MTTNFSLSQTLASGPKCFLKTPMVPGPQTSWVMSTSTLTQTFSPGATASRPAARARIFSVSVIAAGISRLRYGRGCLLHHTVWERGGAGQTARPAAFPPGEEGLLRGELDVVSARRRVLDH